MESIPSFLYSAAVAVGGVFLILLGWVAVEEFVRRKSPPMPEGCELPEGYHGCRHCMMGDTCAAKQDEDDAEEPDAPSGE